MSAKKKIIGDFALPAPAFLFQRRFPLLTAVISHGKMSKILDGESEDSSKLDGCFHVLLTCG